MAHPQVELTAPAGPVLERERILALDALRGLAVLGILVMNIHGFSQIFADYLNPIAYRGSIHGTDYWIWLANHLVAEEKMMAIFCMLYGAGIVLLSSRIEARDGGAFPVYLRRSFWLLVFGAAHAYLLWSGDILVSYAICGVAVFGFRHWEPPRLLAFGLGAVAIGSALSLLAGWSMPLWPSEDIKLLTQTVWQPSAPEIARQVAAYRGGWLAQMPLRASESLETDMQGLAFMTFWRAGGLMLVGMALYKMGLLTGSLSPRVYRRLAAAGTLFGFPLIAYGVHRNFQENWSVRYSFFTGSQFNYWGSLGIALAWISVVMLVCKSPAWRGIVTRFAAMGRMAFSNYILETVLGTLLFYGTGFGLFGRVNRVEETEATIAIWIVVFTFSQVWMRYFLFGPLEWLWRSLTYQRIEPLRRPGPGISA